MNAYLFHIMFCYKPPQIKGGLRKSIVLVLEDAVRRSVLCPFSSTLMFLATFGDPSLRQSNSNLYGILPGCVSLAIFLIYKQSDPYWIMAHPNDLSLTLLLL